MRQTVAYINTAYESTIHPDDIRNKANRYWEERTYQNSNKVNHFRKYTGSDTYESLNIVPVLRLAEMYLILVEDSPLSEASGYFKTYRIARNLDISIDNSLVTEQDVLNRMEKEYRKEFFEKDRCGLSIRNIILPDLLGPRIKLFRKELICFRYLRAKVCLIK